MFEPIPHMIWVALFFSGAGGPALMAMIAADGFARRAKHWVVLLALTFGMLTLEAILSYTLIQTYGVWFGLETLVRALVGHDMRIPEESGAAMLAIIFIGFVASLGAISVGFAFRMRGAHSAAR